MARQAQGNTPNREEMFNMAVEAAERGNRQSARMMFAQVLRQDRRDTRVMMWLAKLAKDPQERRQWLNRVLDVNPNHEQAIATLDRMDYQDKAKRNIMFFRVAIGAYMAIVLLLGLIVLLIAL